MSALTTDDRLTLVYKTMFGLNNIDNTSGNTTLQGQSFINSHFLEEPEYTTYYY